VRTNKEKQEVRRSKGKRQKERSYSGGESNRNDNR